MMRTATFSTWLGEVVATLTPPGGADVMAIEDWDDQIDALLARGLDLEPGRLQATEVEQLISVIGLLAAARATVGAEIVAVHRERLDVDRTVKAITAYVKALS